MQLNKTSWRTKSESADKYIRSLNIERLNERDSKITLERTAKNILANGLQETINLEITQETNDLENKSEENVLAENFDDINQKQ
jgi:hypothetical protein